MNRRQCAALLFLAAVWGASFLFIRIAAPVLGPFPLMAARVLVAAAALWCYATVRRMPIVLRPYGGRLLVLGLVHAAAPFALIAMAEVHVSASMAAVLIATQPLFAALISGLWLHDRVTLRQATGLLLGLIGVAVLVGWSPDPLGPAERWGVAACLAGAVCYAAGSQYARQKLADAPVLTIALGQQLGAAVWLLVPALVALPRLTVTVPALFALVTLALLCTAAAYLVFFKLLGEIGVVKTSVVTYIIPIFGVLWGALFLGEVPTIGVLAGLGCILGSLAVVNNVGLRLPLHPPRYDATTATASIEKRRP